MMIVIAVDEDSCVRLSVDMHFPCNMEVWLRLQLSLHQGAASALPFRCQ